MTQLQFMRTVLAALIIWRGAARPKAAALLLAAGIAACTPVIRNHGYVPVEQDLALVEVGVDTRDTVTEKIGRPSTSGLLNDEGWYYVQSQYRLVGPRQPQEIDRKVLAVTFSEAGVVENIALFGLEDGKVVELSRRVTETNINGVSIITQLLGSFGRISAEDVFAQ
jgi:outer membrane protein assembly factor BamE (lipoprotein component of BamABCDE complex)